MALRLAIHDADDLVAHGLMSMLQRHSESVRLVNESSGALDIVLYDPSLPAQAMQDSLSGLRDSGRATKVVVYTWNFQPWSAGDWIRQGASGYLSKRLPVVGLVAALEAIHTGRVIVAPTGAIVASQSAWTGKEEGLTQREAQTLSLIAAGLSNADLAERMSLSINSVKSYIRSTYRKIGADSRSQAVLWAVAHGFGTHTHPEHRAAERIGA